MGTHNTLNNSHPLQTGPSQALFASPTSTGFRIDAAASGRVYPALSNVSDGRFSAK
jgi:hypothetical protein